jgi:hypothetical protein
MRKLLLLIIVILGIGCTSLDGREKPQEQEVLPNPSPPPRYHVVYRDRSTLVDPAFAAIERRWEYLLEVNEPRRWIWEKRQ